MEIDVRVSHLNNSQRTSSSSKVPNKLQLPTANLYNPQQNPPLHPFIPQQNVKIQSFPNPQSRLSPEDVISLQIVKGSCPICLHSLSSQKLCSFCDSMFSLNFSMKLFIQILPFPPSSPETLISKQIVRRVCPMCIQESLLQTIDNTRKCTFCHQVFLLDPTTNLFILQTSSPFSVLLPNNLQTQNFSSNNNHILQKIIEKNKNDLEIEEEKEENGEDMEEEENKDGEKKKEEEENSEEVEEEENEDGEKEEEDEEKHITKERREDIEDYEEKIVEEEKLKKTELRLDELPELIEKEEIRFKLLEGICPDCKIKDLSLERGRKRECKNCKTVWLLNEDGFFENENKIQNEIWNGTCPKCKGIFKQKDKGEERICDKCKKIYILEEVTFKEMLLINFYKSLKNEKIYIIFNLFIFLFFFYFFIHIFLNVFLFPEKLIKITTTEQKESILQNLKSIPINSKQECVSILNESIMKDKILLALPVDDKNDLSVEVANAIMNLLIKVSLELFYNDNSKEEKLRFKSKFSEYDGYNILFFLLNIYENTELKLLTAVILGKFSCYDVIVEEGKIIIDILVNYLKDYVGRLNKNTEDKNIFSVIGGLIGISLNDKNKKLFIDMGIVSLLLPVIETSDINALRNAVCLLSNICCIESVEDKNSIINLNVFNTFYKKLLKISPSPPQKMVFENYYLVAEIVRGISNLFISNPSGVKSFLKTNLIPVLLWTFNSSIAIIKTTFNKNINDIILRISNCFSKCCDTYENVCYLVENEVVDFMINVIEIYVLEIKKKKNNLKENIVKNASLVIYKLSIEGSNAVFEGERNKFGNYFDENNRLIRLIDAFKFLILNPLIHKEIINYISISICELSKREEPSHINDCVFKHINNLKSLPSPVFGHDFPFAARKALERYNFLKLFFLLLLDIPKKI
jgi:hypothetical protein